VIPTITPVDFPALLGAVKALRFAQPRAAGCGLDGASIEPRISTYVMVGSAHVRPTRRVSVALTTA
jgi:hypothetical protein